MSFMEPRSSPFILPGSDAISIFPQFSVEPTAENRSPNSNPSPFKRARTNSDENLTPVTNNNINNNNNIFWKTRLCAKFKAGMCRNGEHCNFAHGIDDMRQPPANWQEIVGIRAGEVAGEDVFNRNSSQFSGEWEDDQKIIHRMKLCKKFCSGEECPYGDRCNFLHEDPAKFREDTGRIFRESSAISIGTEFEEPSNASTNIVTNNNSINNCSNSNSNASLDLLMRGNVKPSYWKTKLCNKWEQTGHCPFGDKCHFAHGHPELQASCGRLETESMSLGSLGMKSQSCPGNDLVSPGTANLGAFNDDRQSKKCLLRWKGLKKINRIYGDWLDDLPLSSNIIPSRVES